jgi:hypothetical protein
MMARRILFAAIICAFAGAIVIAQVREWQSGTWRDMKIDRPKVLIGVQTRDPNSNLPRTAAAREVRTFVIDTATHSLELRQEATIDTPQIDATIGEPVVFAIEKKTVYVKAADGKEHKLSLRKKTPLQQ